MEPLIKLCCFGFFIAGLGFFCFRQIGVAKEDPSPLAASEQSRASFKLNTQSANLQFPKSKVDMPPMLQRRLGSATKMSQLFQPQRMVVLEETEQSILSRIGAVCSQGGYWFVLDEQYSQIYQFFDDGKFCRIVGSQGRGPGEYLYPHLLSRVFDGNVGVYDFRTSRTLVYAPAGDHVLSSPAPGPGTQFLYHTGPVALWPKLETYYAFNISSPYPEDPWHVAFDFTVETQKDGLAIVKTDIQTGFGKRYNQLFSNVVGQGNIAYYTAVMVDGLIWTGSPLSTEISVYDPEGRQVAVLGPDCRDCLSHQMLAETSFDSRKEIQAFLKEHGTNQAINVVGSLVFVQHAGKGTLVYDIHGNLVRDQPLIHDLGLKIYDSFDQSIVTVYHPENRDYFKLETQMLRDEGYNPDPNQAANPVLRISTLSLD